MNFEAYFGILTILSIALLIIVSYKGFLYDITKEDIDKKYKKNHSIAWRNGRFWFSIPRIIIDNLENKEIQKKKKDYNKFSIIFWTIVLMTVIIYLKSGIH